jgi:hypothetical protein
MKHVLRWLVLILVVVTLGVPSAVRADIAPPDHPPGSNPGPEIEGTQVRMVAETVTIDVLGNTPSGSLGQAKVTADFTMRNLGSTAESMAVRFPISSNDGWGKYPEIKDMRIFVDNKTVSTRRILEVDPVHSGPDPVPWSEFDVVFPPDMDVNIRVTYTVEGTGEYPYVAFRYIFHTGAGWQGTIGSADLIVRLPYEANSYNVIFDDQIGWSLTTPGGVINGREVRWHFEDFEPERIDDFQLSLVMPLAWRKVLDEQANIQKNPNDGEAWGRLGKVYKEIQLYRRGYRLDAGGTELYQLSIDAYEKAVTLKPDDALWHAGFADLLAVHAYYENFGSTDASPDALRAMQEINRALELAPNDSRVKEIAETIYYLFIDAVEQTDNGYVFHWLTATPIPASPTPAPVEPTSTPQATTPPLSTETAIPAPAGETTPTSVPPPTAKNPLCGSVLFIPLALIMFAGKKRKHSGL